MTNMMDDFMAECEFVGAKKQTIKTEIGRAHV